MKYFISTSNTHLDGNFGFGQYEHERDHEIADYEDIKEIAESIRNQYNFKSVIILNAKRFPI